jgi:hypothetical protein
MADFCGFQSLDRAPTVMAWTGRAVSPGGTMQARLEKEIAMTDSTVTTIGIDLGKNRFHLIGMTNSGKIVLRRRVSRDQLVH